MKIYFATGNKGKVKEAKEILSKYNVEQLEADITEPSVDSIEKIALSKVEQANEQLNKEEAVIADDSGLFVEGLNGFPGPQTAFFDRKVGKEKILDLVEPGTDAEFRAAIGLHKPGDENKVFAGKIKGEIVKPRGSGGFAYDPLFLPEDSDKTWGEKPELKNKISHRQKALEKLRANLG